MARVEFDDEKEDGQMYPSPVLRPVSESPMYRTVIKMGFAKTEKSAERFLVVLAIVCLLAAIGLFIFTEIGAKTPPSTANLPQGIHTGLPPGITVPSNTQ